MSVIKDEYATLVELVRARADAHPDRGYHFQSDGTDVTESLSYGELERDARKVAATLQRNAVAKGSRVVLLYPTGLEFVRAFWGCFYAGAIAVPVPPPHPVRPARTVARLRTIVEDCRPDVVLTSSALLSAWQAVLAIAPELASTKVLVTDGTDADPGDWKPVSASSSDIAVLQYTSGSTRDPRGVMISHGNMLHNLAMLREFHQKQEHMVMISWLPLYHDMGLIRGMMSPLHMGGDCFMMGPMEFAQQPVKWLATVTAHRGTTTGSPNFGYELATRKIADEDLAKLDLSSLEVVFASAEPIRKGTIERFVDRFAPCGLGRGTFRAAYGLAEATVAVAGELGDGLQTFTVSERAMREGRVVASSPSAADAYDLVSCGEPLGDQDVAIVDPQGRRCAPDQIGEVWVRGRSVARGYWHREEDTRAVFGAELPDGSGPFLRTGDLGCFTPKGGLCIVGRKKDIVIVRGQNYYPHDVEATVEAADARLRPGCSAVFGVDVDGSDSLVVVAECDGRVTTGDVRWNDVVAAVRSAVGEEHEVAIQTVCLIASGKIPKTASGKVQRAAAKRMYLAGEFEPLHTWSAPPATTTDDKEAETLARLGQTPPPVGHEAVLALAAIWSDVLGVERIGPDDDFFKLGSDSLQLMRVIARVGAVWGVELKLAEVFKASTVAGMAAMIAAAPAARQPAPVRTDVPSGSLTSFVQDQILNWEAPRERSSTWSQMRWANIRGPLDTPRLIDAIRRMTERQESLRQVFDLRTQAKGWGAKLCSSEAIPIERRDLTGQSDQDVQRFIETEMNVPFAIAGDPLVRFFVLERGPSEHVLLVKWHHLVHDPTAADLFMTEILEHYFALGEKRAPRLPTLPIRYVDYAKWERDWFLEGSGRADVEAARKRLASAKASELTDHSKKAVLSPRKVGAQILLDAAESERFSALCRTESITPFMAFSAIVGAFVGRWTGQDEVVFLAPANLRNKRPEVTHLMGRFNTLIAVRLTFGGAATWHDLFSHAREAVLNAYASEQVPLSLVLGTDRPLDQPLGRVVLNVLGEVGTPTPTHHGDLTVVQHGMTGSGARNPLFFVQSTRNGRLAVHVGAAADLFDQATIEKRAAELRALIAAIDPTARVMADASRSA